jgi:hypothetical protein
MLPRIRYLVRWDTGDCDVCDSWGDLTSLLGELGYRLAYGKVMDGDRTCGRVLTYDANDPEEVPNGIRRSL